MRADSPPGRESRPVASGPAENISATTKNDSSLPQPGDILADLDAMAEHLRGRLVVQVEVDEEKYRTHIYRSTAAAERCVQRAAERGRRSHVTLVRMLPVGVVVGLNGGAP